MKKKIKKTKFRKNRKRKSKFPKRVKIKKFHHETLESLSKLSLNNHPFKIYVENLFNRRN